MSEAQKGKTNSGQFKKGHKPWIKGKHLSEESKRKISEALKGKKLSEETKRKISVAQKGEKHPNYGKHFSKETKRDRRSQFLMPYDGVY